jgi:hypothetical protein
MTHFTLTDISYCDRKQRSQPEHPGPGKPHSSEGSASKQSREAAVSGQESKPKRKKPTDKTRSVDTARKYPGVENDTNALKSSTEVFRGLSSIPLFENASIQDDGIPVEVQSQPVCSELCPESDDLGEMNEEDEEEELFEDLETVDEDIAETSFQDLEDLFGSFL